MTIAPRLDLRTAQTLVMTPQLQQAIKLLQMSNLELTDYIATEIEQNPLLERDDDTREAPLAEQVATEGENFSEPAKDAPQGDADPLPLSGDIASSPSSGDEDVWAKESYGSEESFSPSHNNSFDGVDFSMAENVAEGLSLRQHLLGQIQIDIHEPADQMIASALVELIDEAGYLPQDLELVRTQLGATPHHFEAVIERMQRFDPAGIFARSLQECLALQLRDKDRLDPAMEKLLQHLDLLAKHEMNQLMRLCLVDNDDLKEMVAEIRELNPKPAMAYASEVAQPIVPDVLLRAQPGGGWQVELNNENLPRVLANEKYYAEVQASAHTKIDRDYLTDRWQQANWLVKALNQRATTILKVSAEIVRQQDKFFVHGVQHLRPLILRDIAAAVEMHESTVSRVTQHKFINTPRGLFELKYFFTTGLNRADGGDTISSESVRERIRALIETEKPEAVLSDDRITLLLQGEGIEVARRTVAKYREAMRIASSSQRRREKRNQR